MLALTVPSRGAPRGIGKIAGKFPGQTDGLG